MKILISGGAGYIGATIASMCIDNGITPIILDSLVSGPVEFTKNRVFYEGDISNEPLIDKIFSDHPNIFAVVHCAALIVVPDSSLNPIEYYRANVAKSLDFIEQLIRNGCHRLIFSSSASIYDARHALEVNEETPLGPQSPYARTKAMCEAIFEDITNATTFKVLSLRYFNPIGADPSLRTGLYLSRPTHALGKMMLALEEGSPFEITGTDYPTRDGTGIRDYVHVWDLARAHLQAVDRFDEIVDERTGFNAINLGTGRGTTVRELLGEFNRISPRSISSLDAPRRLGDTAGSYASKEKAKLLLGWEPRLSLAEGIRDSLLWLQARPSILGW